MDKILLRMGKPVTGTDAGFGKAELQEHCLPCHAS